MSLSLSSWSTSDVLMVISEYAYEALDKNDEARTIVLNISKAFGEDSFKRWDSFQV